MEESNLSFVSDDSDYLKTDLKFEQGGVSQKFSINEHKRREVLIPGRLYITENRFGEYLEWKPEEEYPTLHGTSGSGIGFKAGHGSNTNDTIEFKPDQQLLGEFRRNLRIDLAEIRSFQIIGNNEVIFYCCDGSTQNPFIFTRGSPDNLVTALDRSVSITRGRQRNLYIVGPKIKEIRQSEITIPVPEHINILWDFAKEVKNDPYTAVCTAFATIGNLNPINNHHRSPTHNRIYTPVNPPNSHASPRPESREDSNGMEADYATNEEGYEVIFKPETLGIDLPPRPDTYRGQPLSPEQWLNYMEDNSGKIRNPHEILQIIFKGGIDADIRKHVWPFLLEFYKWDSTFQEREEYFLTRTNDYNRIKNQWQTISQEQEDRFFAFRDFKSLIEKDVARTDRSLDFFKEEGNCWTEILRNILMTYMMYNFNLGYVQGMSDILAPILMEVKEEVMCFFIFAKFMERIEHNFEMSQECMQRQLKDLYILVQLIDPKFSAYLQACDADNMYFAFRWLLILFKREFSTSDTLILWEALWTKLPGHNFQLFIALAILYRSSSTIIELKHGLSEILRHCNDLSMKIDLEDTLKLAEAFYLQVQVAGNQGKLPKNIRKIIGLVSPDELDSKSGESSELSSPANELNNVTTSSADVAGGDASTSIATEQRQNELIESNYENGINQFLS